MIGGLMWMIFSVFSAAASVAAGAAVAVSVATATGGSGVATAAAGAGAGEGAGSSSRALILEIGGRTDFVFPWMSFSGLARTVFTLGSMSETVSWTTFGSGGGSGAASGAFFAGAAEDPALDA